MKKVIGFVIFGVVVTIFSIGWLDKFIKNKEGIDFNLDKFVPLITGAIAIVLYHLERHREKSNAAKIILQEIRRAENSINNVRNLCPLETISVLPTNSWGKYQHLFLSDLDQDELGLISNFYELCSVIDKEVRNHQASLRIANDEKRKVIQKKLLDLAGESGGDEAKYKGARDKILKIFHEETYFFKPHAPDSIISRCIPNIKDVTTSSCGEKLKFIARIK